MEQTKKYIRESLISLYPEEEIRWITRIIFYSVCGMPHNLQISRKDTKISENDKKKISLIIKRLQKSEPLQYILGETEFYSIPLKISPSVLIPRPETAELADMIIKQYRSSSGKIKILDAGTGSGCIAIALAKHLPAAEVTAVDISAEALQVARSNAAHCNIRFLQADILETERMVNLFAEDFDVIVSNPPYVQESEKQFMNVNVVDYEPHIALFVPDNHPLLYYESIAAFAAQKLSSNGMMYFEINPLLSEKTKKVFDLYGFKQTSIVKDLSGKNRFITVKNQDL